MNKKIRFNKKVFFYSLGALASIGAIGTVLGIKITNPYKPAFYIYSSYVDQTTQKNIDKKYSLKEYGDLNEFDYAISNQKAVAGITSDYLIVNLIKEGKIAPVSKDLKEILFEKKEIQSLDEDLSLYFSDEAQEQMRMYNEGFGSNDSNKYLISNHYNGLLNDNELQKKLNEKYPEYGSNYKFRINDFVVPYFMNDRVYAFDTKKILNKTYEIGHEINPLEYEIDSNGIPIANSTIEALKKIFDKKSNVVIQWTKNEIENSIIGSEYNNLKDFSTLINNNNYEALINNFNKIVTEGTGSPISNNSVNIFEPDSDIILNNLINPSSRIKSAVLYNGDALDAYYGHDNFQDVKDGDRVRIIRTKNNIRVLDAFVVSADLSKEYRKELLEFFNVNLFNNMFKNKNEIQNEIDVETKKDPEFDIYQTNGIMRIFDYVNYTPAAKGALDFIRKNYFKIQDANGQEVDDEVALNIFNISETAIPIAPIDKETVSKLKSLFQKTING